MLLSLGSSRRLQICKSFQGKAGGPAHPTAERMQGAGHQAGEYYSGTGKLQTGKFTTRQ